MVADQEQHFHRPLAQAAEALDHARGIWAAIDEVPKEDDLGILSFAFPVVSKYHFQQPVEQVEPSVDVAHRIDPLPIRNGKARCAKARNEAKELRDWHSY